MADATRKLSKRYGDPSFEDLLDMGYLRDAIINFIALLGWSPRNERELYTMAELEEIFDVEGLNKSPSLFDMQKLTWFNAEYMRKLPFEEYLRLATRGLKSAGARKVRFAPPGGAHAEPHRGAQPPAGDGGFPGQAAGIR